MNRNQFLFVLIAEAGLCATVSLLCLPAADFLPAALAFPFGLIGAGLRRLALLGPAGNTLAWMLFAALGVIPIWFFLRKKTQEGIRLEDWLLVVISAGVVFTLWLAVNPTWAARLFPERTGSAMMAIAGSLLWSTLIAYLVLRILRAALSAERSQLWSYLRWLLHLMAVIFVAVIFGVHLSEMVGELSAFDAQAIPPVVLGFTLLRFIVVVLPWLLDIIAVFLAMEMLDHAQDPNVSGRVAVAKKLSRWSGRALTLMVLVQLLFNFLQLALIMNLPEVEITVNIPIFSIGFVLVILWAARLLEENQQLKEENDLFV